MTARQLDSMTMVSGQIQPADIAELKGAGVTMIVNNRPDGEAPDQVPGAEIAQAASQSGLDYVAIPVDHSGFSEAQVAAMREALDRAGESRLLAYCRSGTRSTLLWALARASMGDDPEALTGAAAGAGYDVGPVRPAMDALAVQASQS